MSRVGQIHNRVQIEEICIKLVKCFYPTLRNSLFLKKDILVLCLSTCLSVYLSVYPSISLYPPLSPPFSPSPLFLSILPYLSTPTSLVSHLCVSRAIPLSISLFNPPSSPLSLSSGLSPSLLPLTRHIATRPVYHFNVCPC